MGTDTITVKQSKAQVGPEQDAPHGDLEQLQREGQDRQLFFS